MRFFQCLFLCLVWVTPSFVGAQQVPTVDVPITADNSIIDTRSERDFNMGAASSIRLKSFQHHLILKHTLNWFKLLTT